MSIDPNRKAFNSTLRPKSLKRIEAERNGTYVPKPMRQRKKPLSLKEVKERFNIITAAALGEPKKIKAKKYRKPIAKRSKTNNGWWDVALEIWAEREHRCAVTGAMLGDEPLPIFFSHLLPRSTYRLYKRDKRNIILKSPDTHRRWHKYGPEVLKAYPEWKVVTGTYFMLRDEANGLSKQAPQ